jgi:uncharacterized protein (DUF1330 family)
MAAYVISEVQILDVNLGEKYKVLAAKSIADHGGKYIVRGAKANVIEGASTDRQIVIVEFLTMEQLKAWYASPEYAEALKIRQTALDRKLTFVEGI